MKKKYIKWIVSGCALILFLCIIKLILFNDGKAVKNINANKFPNKCKITRMSNKTFKLDSETSYLSSYIQFIDKNGACYFSFINEYNNSIYFYDYDNSIFVRKIKYEKEGNNGVGKIQGYYYVSDDTIYTYAYRGNKVFITNSNSSIVNSSASLYENIKYNNVEDIVSFPPSPYVQTDNPIRVVGDNIVLGGYIGGEYLTEDTNNRMVNILYNMVDRTVRYINNYPELYQKYNWGGGLDYRLPHFEISNKKMVISFSADHDVRSYSFENDSSTSHYAGSSFIDRIEEFPYSKILPINKDKARNWYMQNPSYEGVYYDKYRDVYYRIARLPHEHYMKHEFGNRKPIVVIVLDSDLKYLGEGKLPTSLNLRTTNCFVSKDGFNIQLLNDNEDYFTFCQFKIEIN